MRYKITEFCVSCLFSFIISLLVFSVIMPLFSLYLTTICVVACICVLLYRIHDNRQFYLRMLCLAIGNSLAFILNWFLLGRKVILSDLEAFDIVLLLLIVLGAIGVLVSILPKDNKRHGEEEGIKSPRLFPERTHDLQRLLGFLQNKETIVGVDALWGDGKTFLIDQLCAIPNIRKEYEIIRIGALAGNEDEIEMTLMNEFDRILRKYSIFSQASKQMLRLLNSNDILKRIQWILIEDEESVSTTLSLILNDLGKVCKKILIVVDDIERVGDDNRIRKLFALMESVCSEKIQVLYMYNSQMLSNFDRDYLEKYIPCYMGLTPIQYRSIVHALWDEMEMDVTGIDRQTVEKMVVIPDRSYSIYNILMPDMVTDQYPFHLENVTIRRVRIFLQEFRNLVCMDSVKEVQMAQKNDHELLLKCLFVKNFLNSEYEQISIGNSVVDSLPFRFNEKANTILQELSMVTVNEATIHHLFDIRRKVGKNTMQRIMNALFSDKENYHRLLTISMLGYDYSDVFEQLRKEELQTKEQNDSQSSRRNPRFLPEGLIIAEQVGNQDISFIEREQNNERIDRIMWNLRASGASEYSDLDAYTTLFLKTVLGSEPENRSAAWREFQTNVFNGEIYKDNITCNRFGVDQFLPLFQGFRVKNASVEQWLALLEFYFSLEDHKNITVEMVQNLNYVDLKEHRVFLAVLKHFVSCHLIGNMNEEPCMYRFIKTILRMTYGLGYATNRNFETFFFLENEMPDYDMLPSDEWRQATIELVKEFDRLKYMLEAEKISEPELAWFNKEIDVILAFMDHCTKMTTIKNAVKMRTLQIRMTESQSRSRHQEVVDRIQQKGQSDMKNDNWFELIRQEYQKGQLDPGEVRKLMDTVSIR